MFEAIYTKNGTVTSHVNVTPDQLLEILKSHKEGKIVNLRVEADGHKFLDVESLIKNLKL